MSAVNWNEHLEHAALSDVGMRRGNNQDSFGVHLASGQDDWQRRGHLFIVADGMGAHAAGELASKMAVDGILHTYLMLAKSPPAESLVQAVIQTNTLIHTRGSSSQDFAGMGTTCSALALLPQGALVAHAGDSRIYRLRGNRVEQLTFDHSLLWEMRATGNMSPDALANLVPKNIITRSLGPNAKVQVDVEGPFPLAVGDTFLLCSDGLSGQVSDEEIGAFMACLPPQEAAQALIDLANMRGGPDNITVLIAKVKSPFMTQADQPLLTKAAKDRDEQKFPLPAAIVGGVAALLGLALLAMGQWIIGAAALVVGAVAGALGWVKKNSGKQAVYLPAGTMLGKGPHVAADATPNATILAAVSSVVQQLRDVAQREKWPVQTPVLNQHLNRSQTAATAKDFTGALREQARALSYIIGQLRKANLKRAAQDEDSVI